MCLSYNFPTNTNTIGATSEGRRELLENKAGNSFQTILATHLSSQCYTICVRREEGFCSICYIPSVTDDANDAAAMQNSFGLS